MKREVISKYKKVFLFWLDGGGFWTRSDNIGAPWEHFQDPNTAPMLGGFIYVEDDKYSKERMAQKDGKLIIMRTSITRSPSWIRLDAFSRSDITEVKIINFSEASKYDIDT